MIIHHLMDTIFDESSSKKDANQTIHFYYSVIDEAA